jgi:uncharacterized protein YdcH (DUF465 family)
VGFTQIFADEERGNGLSMWVFDDWILNGGNDLFSGFFFTQIFADDERVNARIHEKNLSTQISEYDKTIHLRKAKLNLRKSAFKSAKICVKTRNSP